MDLTQPAVITLTLSSDFMTPRSVAQQKGLPKSNPINLVLADCFSPAVWHFALIACMVWCPTGVCVLHIVFVCVVCSCCVCVVCVCVLNVCVGVVCMFVVCVCCVCGCCMCCVWVWVGVWCGCVVCV